MSLAQRVARTLLPPSWFDRIRESSEKWMIQCPHCKSEKSVWSAGGIRYGAMSKGKVTAVRCSKCEKMVMANVYYKDLQ